MKKSELKNKTFECTRIVKGLTIEDIPAMRENLLKQVEEFKAKGIDASMQEDETCFRFNNGQFVMKPKQAKETKGILKCGSSFIKFDNVRIEYTDIIMTDKGFETNNAFYNFM